MLIIVISLLLSITISNIFYAMNQEEAIEISSDQSFSTIYTIDELPQTVFTLDSMKKLSKKIGANHPQTRGKNRQRHKFEIPENITIDPQIFLEYANEENLITKLNPGWLKRILCCRSDEKNRFRHLSSDKHEEWTTIMLAMYSEQDDQTEATTRDRSDNLENSFLVNSATQNNNNNDSRGTETFNFDEEELENNDDVAKRLSKAEWMCNQLVKKHTLNEEIRKLIEQQQQSEEKTEKRKERMVEVLALLATCLITYYGSDTC